MFTIYFQKPRLYKDAVQINQGNLSTNDTLRCKVIRGGESDLKDCVITATFKTSSHNEINGTCKAVDIDNNIIDIVFPSNALEVGINHLEVVITKIVNGKTISVSQSPTIKYEVWQGLTTENGIKGDSKYPILVDLISATQDANNKADKTLNTVNSMITNVDSKLTEAKRVIQETKEVKEQAQETIKEVNRAIAAGTQDLEVKEARKDGNGVVHDTLNQRLEADLAKGKIHYETIEGSYINVNDTLDSYVENIEIKGNTVQNPNNLADIKSVGDKVGEQELYRIPILCCGENIINPKGFTEKDQYNICYQDIKVKANTKYRFSYDGEQSNMILEVAEYDKNNSIIGGFTQIWKGSSIVTKSNTFKVRLKVNIVNINKVQMAEGDLLQYKAYRERKLNILSPVQLCKIGNVSDRIIEKNGVWGVEKDIASIDTSFITEVYSNPDNKKFTTFGVIPNILRKNQLDYIKSFNVETWTFDGNEGKLAFNFLKESGINSLVEAKKYLNDNNVIIKYPTTNPQFIPLPDDQQIKLHAFTNQTNISFLTEVEGTIKADIPKSIGASVNSNTRAIQDLNKDLEKVKRLEDVTTSTITTSSNFTTVEETTNGYLSDIKLEGKTLVNLATCNNLQLTSPEYNFNRYDIGKSSQIKPNTAYTIISWATKNTNHKPISTDSVPFQIVFGGISSGDNWGCRFNPSVGDIKSYEVSKFTTPNDFKVNNEDLIVLLCERNRGSSFNLSLVILEGDYTQNPPEFFEGMKSVGDNVDDIVVSSIRSESNLCNIDTDIVGAYSYGDYKIDDSTGSVLIRCEPNTQYYVSAEDNDRSVITTYTRKPQRDDKASRVSEDRSIITGANDKYLLYYFSSNINAHPIKNVYIGKTPFSGSFSCNIDKKKLLYYDTESQTWKKPILREGDSIEKHSDGKYYYHKRKNMNSFSDISAWNLEQQFEGVKGYYAIILDGVRDNKNTSVVDIICDLLKPVSAQMIIDKANCKPYTIAYDSNYNVVRIALPTNVNIEEFISANNGKFIYKLAQEKVYECTPIDLITFENETNYFIECGAISPKTTLKSQNYIGNVINTLKDKVSYLEDKLYKTNLANFTVALNALDTKLKLDKLQSTK